MTENLSKWGPTHIGAATLDLVVELPMGKEDKAMFVRNAIESATPALDKNIGEIDRYKTRLGLELLTHPETGARIQKSVNTAQLSVSHQTVWQALKTIYNLRKFKVLDQDETYQVTNRISYTPEGLIIDNSHKITINSPEEAKTSALLDDSEAANQLVGWLLMFQKANMAATDAVKVTTRGSLDNLTDDSEAAEKIISTSGLQIFNKAIENILGPKKEVKELETFQSDRPLSNYVQHVDNAFVKTFGEVRPLYKTPQALQRFKETGSAVTFRIPEAAMDMTSQKEVLDTHHKVTQEAARLATNLYFEGLNSDNPSEIAKIVTYCLENRMPSHYPRPKSKIQEGTSVLDVYRKDLVPTVGKNGQVSWVCVENDAAPGGAGITSALLEVEGAETIVDAIAETMKLRSETSDIQNPNFDPAKLTILRQLSVFDRPEHFVIAKLLEEKGITANVVDIESLESANDIEPGFVWFYGTSASLYGSESHIAYQILTNPKFLSDSLELNMPEDQIALLTEVAKNMEHEAIKNFKRHLVDFSGIAVNYLIENIYPADMFSADLPGGQKRREDLDLLIKTEMQKRNSLSDSLIDRNNIDTIFLNNPSSLRITGTKLLDAIVHLPGFRDRLESDSSVTTEEINSFYDHCEFTIPTIAASTGIEVFDKWLQQARDDIAANPRSWVIKLASDPLLKVDWGARSVIGGPDYNPEKEKSMKKWLTIVEKVFEESDLPFIAQKCVEIAIYDREREQKQKDRVSFEGLEQLGKYIEDKKIAIANTVLRISPFCIGVNARNGIYTGEESNGNGFETAHGGSDSAMGALIIR